MYNDKIVDDVIPLAKQWSLNERKYLIPALNAIEKYIQENNLIVNTSRVISDINNLNCNIDSSDSLDSSNDKICNIFENDDNNLNISEYDLDYFKYEIYTEEITKTGKNIVDLLNKLGYKKSKYEIFLPNYETRIHFEGYKQIVVIYNNLYPTYVNINVNQNKEENKEQKYNNKVIDLFPTMKIQGLFSNTQLNCFSVSVQIVYQIQMLYSPLFYDKWENILSTVVKLGKLFNDEKLLEYVSGKGEKNKEDNVYTKIQFIKNLILSKYRLGKTPEYACVYIGTFMNKIQF